MTHAKLVHFLKECYPEYAGRLYFRMKDLARIYTNENEDIMRIFIIENAVPFYRIGKNKGYNILEVQEAVEKTRWRQT